MMSQEIRVFAPATVANVACGFDIFGFALETPGDEVSVRLSDKPGVTIVKISGDNGVLPLDSSKNTAGVAVRMLLDFLQCKQGVEIELTKKMPLGSGLGSSAASAAAALFATNALLGFPIPATELVEFAMEGERVACGSAHADNVAPALLGGFVLIRSYAPLDIIEIPFKPDLYCAVLHPHIEIKTETARKILKKEVSLTQMVSQTGNVAGLITGLFTGDLSLIGRSLHDVVVEPVRATLIPGFYEIKSAALSSGALGCSISGSGPSLFAICGDRNHAEKSGQAMVQACEKRGIGCDLYLSKINKQGPRIL